MRARKLREVDKRCDLRETAKKGKQLPFFFHFLRPISWKNR